MGNRAAGYGGPPRGAGGTVSVLGTHEGVIGMRLVPVPVIAVAVATVLIVPVVCGTAHGDDPVQAPTRIERVALFKNGLGFFVAESTLPDATGPVVMGPFPAASHGTFWVAYPANVGLENLVARETVIEDSVEAITVAELLKANIGKKVRVHVSYEDKVVAEGTIVHFPEDREPTEGDAYVTGGASVPWGRPGGPGQSQLMLIETAEGVVAIAPHAIWRVEFPDKDIARSFTRKLKAAQLHAHLNKPAPGGVLTTTYLAKGITWAPSYTIDVSDPKKGRLSAKATIINEAADLDAVDVTLVTGFPNLRFADVLSPFALKENLAQFLQSLTRGESRREGEGRSVVTQNVMYFGGTGGFGGGLGGAAMPQPAVPDYRAAAAGQAAEDLFLYPLDDVTLEKKEVGYYPLFTESVPYTHIYQWEIPDYVTEGERYLPRPEEPRERPEEVWHSVRIENTTKVPWTTAPAETVQNGQILGQDILSYTPSGGEATVRITQAVSVKATQAEVETARERNAAQFYRRQYDLLSIEGTLSVENFLAKSITLEITKTVSGEVKASAPKADIEKVARGLRGVNPVNVLTWTLELKPGQAQDVTYAYQVYLAV
jgi:hypothetical protein